VIHFRFQSTPSRGGRRASSTTWRSAARFQSTPSRGGRHRIFVAWVVAALFQSTPSRGGRPTARHYTVNHNTFQSTPSRGGRHGLTGYGASGDSFNPRPRAEGDHEDVPPAGTLDVSIHALARRATTAADPWPHVDRVSIHALARRATCLRIQSRIGRCGFNPRPRAEGDVTYQVLGPWYWLFQSTPSRGGRRKARAEKLKELKFQSTPSRGGRRIAVTRRGPDYRFNPRPRAEGDLTSPGALRA